MRLYHSSVASKNILLNDNLKSSYTLASTYVINKALRESGFDKVAEIRENAVFLSNFQRKGNTLISVNLKDLDLTKLYVGSEQLASKIFTLYITSKVTDKYAKAYADSFMSYLQYIEERPFIKTIEYIYTGDIPVDKITFVSEKCIPDEEYKTKVFLNKNMNDYIII